VSSSTSLDITIQLNGANVTCQRGTTLGALLDGRGVERRMIAVEYNGEIVPRHEYDSISLADGDQLEVVQMVGGG
jgi:thiamine biosynthesis protein ThiS